MFKKLKVIFKGKLKSNHSKYLNHKHIDIEPVLGCNLRCRMCHVSFMKEKVKYLDVENIDWSFCKNKTVFVGSVFEPLIHPNINTLFDKLNKVNAKISFITNAHNLNKKEIPALFDSNLGAVTFSFDGITKNSYESVRRGGNFQRTVDNIEKFVASHSANNTKFSINSTILKANMQEVPDAPLFWDKLGIHLLRFIGMVVREDDSYLIENNLWDIRQEYYLQLEKAVKSVTDNKLDIAVFSPYYRELMPAKCPDGIFNKDVADTSIPIRYVNEYDVNSPISNNCISPFTAARIDWNGDLFLCHNQKIGNLIDEDFQTLWTSKNAEDLRNSLIDTGQICQTCDYFKLCIKSHQVDTTRFENYFSNDFKAKNPTKWQEIKEKTTLDLQVS